MEEMEEVGNHEEDVSDRRTPIKRSRTSYRSAESRVADERKPIVFAHVSEFNINPSILADTRYRFGFVPYMRRNNEIHTEYDRAVSMGWVKASKNEYAQAQRIDDPFRRRHDEDDFVRTGGQIMMKRPVEIDDAERRHYDAENAHSDELIRARQFEGPSPLEVYSHSRRRGVGVPITR